MTEPAGPVSLSLLAVFIAFLGPVLGPYALIAFAAVAGGLLALSVNPAGTRWGGVKYLVVATIVALLVTGPIVYVLEAWLKVPARIGLIPVAFVLGAKRDMLLAFITKALAKKAADAGVPLDNAAERGTGQ